MLILSRSERADQGDLILYGRGAPDSMRNPSETDAPPCSSWSTISISVASVGIDGNVIGTTLLSRERSASLAVETICNGTSEQTSALSINGNERMSRLTSK